MLLKSVPVFCLHLKIAIWQLRNYGPLTLKELQIIN